MRATSSTSPGRPGQPTSGYELGTDTFVVRDGKITAQTYAATVTPKG